MSHSPAPWTVGRGLNGRPTIWDGLDRLVATLPHADGAGDIRPGSPHTPEATEANALLIAAAPDMLAALEAVLPILEALDRNYGSGDGRLRVLALVRTAIAATTGGTP